MIVETDFLTHWKTLMLIEELGDKAAPLCLIALWAHCQLRKSDTFHNMAPNALKSICRYEGEASKLRSALERCGWIEVSGEAVIVHGWAEMNVKLLANWENGKKGGRPRNPTETQRKPNDNPTITQNEIGVTQRKPIEKRRIEKIDEIKKKEENSFFLPAGFDSIEAREVFDRWFAYLSKVGKLPINPNQAACAACGFFASVAELERNINHAIANEWTTLRNYGVGATNPTATADKTKSIMAEFLAGSKK
jgi:hypothetical protein